MSSGRGKTKELHTGTQGTYPLHASALASPKSPFWVFPLGAPAIPVNPVPAVRLVPAGSPCPPCARLPVLVPSTKANKDRLHAQAPTEATCPSDAPCQNSKQRRGCAWVRGWVSMMHPATRGAPVAGFFLVFDHVSKKTKRSHFQKHPVIMSLVFLLAVHRL